MGKIIKINKFVALNKDFRQGKGCLSLNYRTPMAGCIERDSFTALDRLNEHY